MNIKQMKTTHADFLVSGVHSFQEDVKFFIESESKAMGADMAWPYGVPRIPWITSLTIKPCDNSIRWHKRSWADKWCFVTSTTDVPPNWERGFGTPFLFPIVGRPLEAMQIWEITRIGDLFNCLKLEHRNLMIIQPRRMADGLNPPIAGIGNLRRDYARPVTNIDITYNSVVRAGQIERRTRYLGDGLPAMNMEDYRAFWEDDPR
jgi:hypothetical protein